MYYIRCSYYTVLTHCLIILFAADNDNDYDGIEHLQPCNGDEVKEAIKQAHLKIKTHIKFTTLEQYFNLYNIFECDEILHFKCDPHEVSVSNLIDWIQGKDEEGALNFIKALYDGREHSGHTEILNELKMKVINGKVYHA